jgi:hypothetical protein
MPQARAFAGRACDRNSQWRQQSDLRTRPRALVAVVMGETTVNFPRVDRDPHVT